MKLVQRGRHASSKMGKGTRAYFTSKCKTITNPSFEKNIFPFSYVAPFGYDKSANAGSVKF